MKKLKIAVLMGGPSAEREVSLQSGREVIEALRTTGGTIVPVVVEGPGFVIPADTTVAFIALHGSFGEDGQIQRILEERGVAYTGSDADASERAFDKLVAKDYFDEAGIPTPATFEDLSEVKFPVVVKPARQGSSVGITIVRRHEELAAACAKAQGYDERIVIEQFIRGRELTVGVLGNRELPVVEIRTKSGFFGYEEKYTAGKAEEIVPAALDSVTVVKAQRFARLAHERLGCRDFSRVDLMLSDRGELFVLEVNTIPGFTDTSLVPKAARAAGMSFEQLCVRLVEMALARAGRGAATKSAGENCPVVRYFRARARERKTVMV
jgi:D-alanine-D-alanine ligase